MSSGPLNLKLATKGVDTSYPALATAEYRVSVEKAEYKESGKTPGLWMLNVVTATQEPAYDTKGNLHQPGFKTTFNITLPSAEGGQEHDDTRTKQLCRFIDACLGTDQKTRPDYDEEVRNSFLNKQIIIVVKAAKDTTYGDTEVKDYKALITAGAEETSSAPANAGAI